MALSGVETLSDMQEDTAAKVGFNVRGVKNEKQFTGITGFESGCPVWDCLVLDVSTRPV